MNDNQMKYVANLIIQLEKTENKYNQLQSNWNSLREWLEILINGNLYSLSFKEPLRNVLDKMNELEGKDKE
jgi:hypothetical protein